jgi:hypothetical protein
MTSPSYVRCSALRAEALMDHGKPGGVTTRVRACTTFS